MKLSNLALLNITVFLKSQSYLLPVILLFYIQNGLDAADFFFFQGIVSFTELILGLPGGYLSDYFSKKTILIFSYFMLFMRYALWLCFGGYWIILSGEICYAIYKSLFQSAAEGYIYQYLSDNEKTAKNLKKFGKFNAAASLGSAFSSLFGTYIFKHTGFVVVLSVQLCIISLGIFLLICIKPVNKAKYEKQRAYHTFKDFISLGKTFYNSKLKFYILTSGIFIAVTSLFVNTFQPLMKFGNVPLMFFGYVYFFNHITRFISSLYTDKIIKICNLKMLGYVCFILCLISFVLMFYIIKYDLFFMVVPLLLFACIGVALVLCLNIGVVSFLQEHSVLENRSMMASLNNTFMRFSSSLILFINTFILEHIGFQYEPVLGIVCLVAAFCMITKLNFTKAN